MSQYASEGVEVGMLHRRYRRS